MLFRWSRKKQERDPAQLAEDEAIRRQAELERRKAELARAEQQQRMESNPTLGPWGGEGG